MKEAPQVTRQKRNPHRFEATVRVKGKSEKLALVPDQVFALEFATGDGPERANFFLEVDRGTMPLKRKSLRGSSIYKKLLTYHAGWKRGRHTEQYGWSRFRVLTVTNSQERVHNVVETAMSLNEGKGSRLFLFAYDRQSPAGSIIDTAVLDGTGAVTTLRA